jgi:hypothetical protein
LLAIAERSGSAGKSGYISSAAGATALTMRDPAGN